MGVVICDSPSGPFSVTVIPKCGSTTVRKMLADVAQPGQYDTLDPSTTGRTDPRVIRKHRNWKLWKPYEGECGDRSWGILRNPWHRIQSRWREKTRDGRETKPWDLYIKAIRLLRATETRSHRLNVAARDQAMYLGSPRPRTLVPIELITMWKPRLEKAEGVKVSEPGHLRHHEAYDWTQVYRDYPNTRDIVREVFAADWDLGLPWVDPLPPASLEERRKAEFPQYERPLYWGVMRPWRVKLVREWLEKQIAACEYDPDYLDVGCGPAETLDMAKELGIWSHGCDVVQSVCNRPDVDLIPGAHDLPYNDNAFGITTCNDVMEHILEEDVPAALREIARVTERAVLLGISQKPGTFHCTIKSTEWWMQKIAENMTGKATIIYADRIKPIKKPYLWVSIE